MKLKNAIITGGSCYHQKFFTNKNAKYANFFSKRIYLPELKNCNLLEFDYILIASRCNQDFLLENKHKLQNYLEKGGNLVLFGEMPKTYIDGIRWRDYPTNFWWWVIPNADLPLYAPNPSHMLFNKISIDDAKWHYHGVFYPNDGCENILVNELGESIIYKDSVSFEGNLYVTSLDPDFHFGFGFMPKTEFFFDKFMEWIHEDILLSNQRVCK
ncbi:hypothetical protein BKH41_09030 [Helicobacter sp. 12S02232-10]|uniref:hypothetical protein n=1 Tax=Helicobacter sp. 12S02232-10 TaxID=1476197 RepID=UPI000BDCC872|nr:hypothetical protein [Helicobacter sp. 12S02232-10]PAF46478.1 hypothetical protein BKH41_09030 [Helicobacter sp. 12S02232-10]